MPEKFKTSPSTPTIGATPGFVAAEFCKGRGNPTPGVVQQFDQITRDMLDPSPV